MNLPGLSCLEHLSIAETMSNLDATLDFEWGSTRLDCGSHAVLDSFAKLLTKHADLEVGYMLIKDMSKCAIKACNVLKLFMLMVLL